MMTIKRKKASLSKICLADYMRINKIARSYIANNESFEINANEKYKCVFEVTLK